MLTTLLSTSVTVGACKPKDKGVDPVVSSKTETVQLSSPRSVDLERVLEVRPRNVTKAEASAALGMLGFDSAPQNYSWTPKNTKNGTYIFEDISATGQNGGRIVAQSLTLTGVHEGEDGATFDRIDIEDLILINEEERTKIEHFTLSRPSPQLAARLFSILEARTKENALRNIAKEIDTQNLSFGAFAVSGVTHNSPTTKASLKTLGWGTAEKAETGVFTLQALRVDHQEGDEPKVDLSLASVTGTGLDFDQLGHLRQMRGGLRIAPIDPTRGDNPLPFGLNPARAGFETIGFNALTANIGSLNIDAPGGIGVATETQTDITIHQVLEPTTLTIDAEANRDDIAALRKNMDSLGYDKIVLSSQQISRLNRKSGTLQVLDSYVDMVDGFRVNYAYGVDGLGAIQTAVENKASQSEINALVDQVALSGMQISLTDNSLMERGFAWAAETRGQSESLLKMQAKSVLMLAGLGAKTQAQGQMISELTGAIGAFIDGGGTLDIVLSPDRPVTLGTLKAAQSGQIPEGLNLSAKVRK